MPLEPRLEAMGLSPNGEKLLAHGEEIASKWELVARSRIVGADALSSQALTFMLPALLVDIAEALTPDFSKPFRDRADIAASHGAERARCANYGPEQIAQEYQFARETISEFAAAHLDLTAEDRVAIDHLIDLALCDSLHAFAFTQEELRRRLAASISHDMRTPLAVVLNGAQLVQRSCRPDQAKRWAEKIANNADRLKEMVGELLDALTFAHGDKLPLELSSFDMADLVKEVCAEYRQMSSTRVRTRCDALPGIWCRKSMRRALENLVNNAVKYGDGQAVDIESKRRGERLILSVHNSGAPIPAEQQNRIFEYFTRDVTAAASVGWGLGLPFVKRVAESHGGFVSVESSAGHGTTFIISVPIDCAPYV
jgi:signal transduction histidine kinase